MLGNLPSRDEEAAGILWKLHPTLYATALFLRKKRVHRAAACQELLIDHIALS